MRCPECGALVDPSRAYEIYDHPNHEELIQVYCSADCVLEALERGYPLKLWNLRDLDD